jgi:hypothetical protein
MSRNHRDRSCDGCTTRLYVGPVWGGVCPCKGGQSDAYPGTHPGRQSGQRTRGKHGSPRRLALASRPVRRTYMSLGYVGAGACTLAAHMSLPGWTHGRVRTYPSSRPVGNVYVRLAWQFLRARFGAPTRASRLQEPGLRGYRCARSGGARPSARVDSRTRPHAPL